MFLSRHEVRCGVCQQTWRENCVDCAEDTAARHRRSTGHAVELTITQEAPDVGGLFDRFSAARSVLLRPAESLQKYGVRP